MSEVFACVMHCHMYNAVGNCDVVIHGNEQRTCELVEVTGVGRICDVGVEEHGAIDRNVVLQSSGGAGMRINGQGKRSEQGYAL